MIAKHDMTEAENNDRELVAQSLAGNRDAFGQIVTRYQSLICALNYSATGNLTQSEDLAQETFLTAWKQLSGLREPGRLRYWLCGIARNLVSNWLRKQGREPSHAAESIDTLPDCAAPEPLPADRAISREEEEILWRSIERIPEIYREPLVLFYREHQSIESVAQALDLNEDAVKQRLSRGRKLLQEQVLAFVQSALERTSPGRIFTFGVLASLPAFATSAAAATIGAGAVKGSATAKAAAATGLAGAILGPLLGIFGSYLGYRMSMDAAQSDIERQFIRKFYLRLMLSILGFVPFYLVLGFWQNPITNVSPKLYTALWVVTICAHVLTCLLVSIWAMLQQRVIVEQMKAAQSLTRDYHPPFVYRSKQSLLGFPLIHIHLGGTMIERKKPIKAWIAVGDSAIGLLFAFGGFALAPISFGGFAVGLFSFGGFAMGLLTLGGFAIGAWAFGGCAIGIWAYGGCAIAWKAAVGAVAIAREYALGGTTQAMQTNNSAAAQYIQSIYFFKASIVAMRHLFWLHALWVVPMIFWWRIVARQAKRNARA